MRQTTAARVLLAIAFVLTLPWPASADPPIVVGNGTAASCTETALKQALLVAQTAGGGKIRFRCGGRATIALRGATEVNGILVLLVLPDDTTLDGDGLITLDGTDTATVILVDTGTNASLKQIAITNGRGPERFDQFSPGAIANLGRLDITKSMVSGNSACCSGRGIGAIWNTGTLTIEQSTIAENAGVSGGGIANEGRTSIRNSLIADHDNVDSGGGLVNTGTLEIVNSRILRNASLDGLGGGIVNFGTLRVKRTLIAENTAIFGAGGIFNSGSLDVENTSFTRNVTVALGDGGAISNSGDLTVENSTFSGNRGGDGGAIFTAGSATITRSVITQNTAILAGGGIFVCVECGGSLTLRRTIVTDNTPDDIFPAP